MCVYETVTCEAGPDYEELSYEVYQSFEEMA